MLYTQTLLVVIAAFLPLTYAAAVTSQAGNFSYFKPPTLKPFIHINLLLDRPVSTTLIDGVSIKVPNVGGKPPQRSETSFLMLPELSGVRLTSTHHPGKITGNITGDLVAVGAAIEFFPSAAKGTASVSDLPAIPDRAPVSNMSWSDFPRSTN